MADRIDGTTVRLLASEIRTGTTADGRQRWRMNLACDSKPASMPADGGDIYSFDLGRTLGRGVAIAEASRLAVYDDGETYVYSEAEQEWKPWPKR